jgi:hypothetical protein
VSCQLVLVAHSGVACVTQELHQILEDAWRRADTNLAMALLHDDLDQRFGSSWPGCMLWALQDESGGPSIVG